MDIKKSYNLKNIKKEIGNGNHFLITILVGLDAIKNGHVSKNKEFSTSWNPKDAYQSASRSRPYAIKSSLAWLVDNFDRYLRSINESPKLLQNDKIVSSFDTSNRSVYNNFTTICENIKLNNINVAFVDLAICWRNRLIHYKASNDIAEESKKTFKNNKSEIQNDYCGLLVEKMINEFYQNDCPTFKEIASIYRGCLNFLEELDGKLLEILDKKQYMKDIISKHKNINLIFDKDLNTRNRKLKNILIQYYSFNDLPNITIDKYINEILDNHANK